MGSEGTQTIIDGADYDSARHRVGGHVAPGERLFALLPNCLAATESSGGAWSLMGRSADAVSLPGTTVPERGENTQPCDLTLGHLFLAAAEHHGHECFLRSADGESLSYNDALCRVARIVQTCRTVGLEKGDRVICYSEDTVTVTLYTLALAIAGIAFVPLSPQFSVHFLRNLMAQASALVVFTSMGYFEQFTEEDIDAIYLSDEAVHHSHGASLFSGVLDDASIEECRRILLAHLTHMRPDDVLMIQPTSGSTGAPKLVVRTHVSVLRYARYVGAQITHPKTIRPRFLMIATLTHAFGFHMLTTAIAMGAELVIPTRLDINGSLQEIRDLDPTVLPLTPRVLRSLHGQFTDTKAPFLGSSAKFLLVAGGAPHSEHLRCARNQGVEIITFYGSTEASLLALTPRGNWREGYAGRIAPDVEMKVSADQELLVRSPGQMLAYLHSETLTREAYTEDGFYKTGDLGEIDCEGYVKVLGRKHDAYITPEGSYVYPERIENLIESLPWVSQAIVVGDRLPYLSALIVVKEDALSTGLDAFRSGDQLSILHETASINIHQLNAQLERIERVARFCLLRNPFDHALYHMVGSGKVCRGRQKVAQFHKRELESLYDTANGPTHSTVLCTDSRRSEQARTNLRIHLVLTFKRFATFSTHDLKVHLRCSIARACTGIDVKILAEEVKHDHVHLLINYPAHRSVEEIVNRVSDESTKDLSDIVPRFREHGSGDSFFDSPYLAVSSGVFTDEMIQSHVNR